MKIAIANDHSAVELKNIIKEHLESKGYEVLTSEPTPQRAVTIRYTVRKSAVLLLTARQTSESLSAEQALVSPWQQTR